jgi:hypothetical protein
MRQKNWLWLALTFLVACGLLLGVIGKAKTQQVPDPNFDATVAHPTYINTHPKVLFDEAHLNFHTSAGGYKPFVELITNDGYQVTPNTKKFQTKTLANYDILVIANALGTKEGQLAFTNSECDAVRNWVYKGGSLLLIADHAPFGAAAENLSMRFGVQMSKEFTIDISHYDSDSRNPGWLCDRIFWSRLGWAIAFTRLDESLLLVLVVKTISLSVLVIT